MDWYVVVEYARVDVTRFEDQVAQYVPGEPTSATVVSADDEDAAIEQAATSAGHYSAHSFVPDPCRFVLVKRG